MAKVTITETVEGKEVVTDFECDQYCFFANRENHDINFQFERQCSDNFMSDVAATALKSVAGSVGIANALHLAVSAMTQDGMEENANKEEHPCEK
jgi:hypothetical protein